MTANHILADESNICHKMQTSDNAQSILMTPGELYIDAKCPCLFPLLLD